MIGSGGVAWHSVLLHKKYIVGYRLKKRSGIDFDPYAKELVSVLETLWKAVLFPRDTGEKRGIQL